MATHLPLPALLGCAAVVALAGCAGTPPARYADLPTASRLQPDSAPTRPYSYADTARWDNYQAIIIEPVSIYRGADHQFGDLSEQDKRELAAAMQQQFSQALGSRFHLSDSARPGTLRLRLTLTGASTNTAVVSTVTRFDLVGLPYNAVQSLRGKEGIFMGSVSYSVAVYDAMDDRLLKAYLARQYPNAMNVGATFGALSAARTGLEKGAEELLTQLQ
ncbi:DUF3313 family protein [Duganella sp. FT80W]|uniref:DUF3313 family protein n=1 Tax=Duganella guangzhouensis TaxID=2666084 RepID=A0A6I2KYR3_9BURK|nr:DUF3313 domain-containing protein [Duganella guangzhouensis]MRW89346.1 DUF3313 family protein [Duganella guangzhouensis]